MRKIDFSMVKLARLFSLNILFCLQKKEVLSLDYSFTYKECLST